MAEVKFTVVREQPVELTAAQERRWTSLKRRKEAYTRLGGELQDALDAFLEDVNASLPAEQSSMDAYRGLTMDERGVALSFCTCPTCQAELYGLPVETVARYMRLRGTKQQKTFVGQLLEHIAVKGEN